MTALFNLGQCAMTLGAQQILLDNHVSPLDLLHKHVRLEQGTLCDEDHQANQNALTNNSRIFSSYEVGNQKIWVITEWDRSVTTLLLPSEY